MDTTTGPERTHWHTVTTTDTDGQTQRQQWAGQPGSAADAQRARARNLRAARRTVRRGPGWLEYDTPGRTDGGEIVPASTTRHEWSEVPPAEPVRFTPADLAAGVRPSAGVLVRVECDDTTGARVFADVLAEHVHRMGCGCWRLEGDRPGPGGSNRLHVLTGCGSHPCGILPGPVVDAVSAPQVAPVTSAPGPVVPAVEACADGPDVVKLSTTGTAALVRQALRAAFPGVTFSVRSSRYSLGSAVNVLWEDGPTAGQVGRVINPYAGAELDGQGDGVRRRGPVQVTDGAGRVRRVRMGCHFVETHRRVTDGHAARFAGLASDVLGGPVEASRLYDGEYGTRWGVWRCGTGAELLVWLAERVDPADLAGPETPAGPGPVCPFADLLAARF